ncbi:VanZ family protein [Niallia sp. 01092]|uniref:VanZ family protein n=1 Tax=unclassified Niallia TaxID=2837522 RepID=UPI003FD51D65
MLKKSILWILFLTYLLLLVYLLFFSAYRQSVHGQLTYNFIPFKGIMDEWRMIDAFQITMLTNNLFGNILAFMPLGFFIPLLFNASFVRTIILSFLLSCFIELLQLLFYIGVCDINDTILNAIGGGVGYCIYAVYVFFTKR